MPFGIRKKLGEIMLNLSIVIIFLVCYKFIWDLTINALNPSFTNSPKEEYTIIIGAISLSITLSSLSFSASRSCEDKNKKHSFYVSGECLFASVLLFIFAFLTRYASVELLKLSLSLPNAIQLNIFRFLILSVFVFFANGIACAMFALMELKKTLITITPS